MQDSSKEERRSHFRVVTPIRLGPVSVFGQEYRICDISLGGLRIRSQKNLQRGEVFRVTLSLPGGEWTEANMRVVWSRKKDEGSSSHPFEIGCEFVDLPFDAQNELWMLLDRESDSH